MGYRIVLLAILAVALLTVPVGPATASETGVTGGVVVQSGETVEDVSAVSGSVLVEEGGTVTGDVSALSGDVTVRGTVAGDVSTATGNLAIHGTVAGDVSAAAGTVHVAEGGAVAGSLSAGAGTVRLEGAVDGDVSVRADTVYLGEEASVGGDLEYAGSLAGNTDAVDGEIRERTGLVGLEVLPTLQPFGEPLFAAYALVLNLLLGAVLLALFPRFSEGVATRVASQPVRTGLVGVGVLVGVPVLLVVLALTLVGIPLSIVGAVLFALFAWVGLVYGRFAVAAWILRAVDLESRWLALLVGMVGGAVLSQVPVLGGLVNLLVFLLGLGALAGGILTVRRRPAHSSSMSS